MSIPKMRFGLVVLVLSLAVAGAVIAAKSGSDRKYSIKKQDEQVVLYTLYRGSYDQVGADVVELYQLAGQKGISPQGPLTFSYLNNPMLVDPEHWLTEMRIPVGKDALKQAGKLGEMTDVKVIRPHTVATCKKPPGVGEAEVETLWAGLVKWTASQGYTTLEGPREVFLSGQETGSYADMKTEFQIPIEKVDLGKGGSGTK